MKYAERVEFARDEWIFDMLFELEEIGASEAWLAFGVIGVEQDVETTRLNVSWNGDIVSFGDLKMTADCPKEAAKKIAEFIGMVEK